VAFQESVKPADGATSSRLRKHALGKPHELSANTFRPKSQALARITARAENHLRDVEWRIGRLGAFVAAGQVDRSLVTERLGVAIELARLEEEPPR
jgi:hypothetical protein